MFPVFLTLFTLYFWGSSASEYHTPSLNEISGYRDPVLNEVFREHQIELREKALPGEAPLLPNTPPPPIAPQNPHYKGELPIQRPENGFQEAYNAASSQIPVPEGMNNWAAAGGRLAYGGAQALYSGAEQFGRAFGIPQAPPNALFDSAARFFG